jgi:hypothetical protein
MGRPTQKNYVLAFKQKQHLAEVLLLVGTLLAVFELPSTLVWIFMFFVIFSVMYITYSMVSSQLDRKDARIVDFFALISSLTFSGVVTFHFAVSFGISISSLPHSIDITLIIFFGYFAVLSYVLYRALAVGRTLELMDDVRQSSSPKHPVKQDTSSWEGHEAFVKYRD